MNIRKIFRFPIYIVRRIMLALYWRALIPYRYIRRLARSLFSYHWTGRRLKTIGRFKAITHADATDLSIRSHVLREAEVVTYPAPTLFGVLPAGWSSPWPAVSAHLPALVAREWNNATILGKSDSIYVQEYAVRNDNINPASEMTFDEVFGFLSLKKGKLILRRFADQKDIQISNAITIIGGPTGNWAHWTTEYLPKLALLNLLGEYQEWPILVDQNLHRNILDSIHHICAGSREIIELPEGAAAHIENAVTVTSPGYTAYEYRYDKEKETPKFKREHTVFSPFSLTLLRQRAWETTQSVPSPSKKIYITRPKGSMRPFVGSEVVESYFTSEGFDIIDTSMMSFKEQVQLFSRASVICGQSGAGLANIIFCPPGCDVIVLAANSPHSIFHYFANMGAASGHRVHYCYGKSIYEPGGHPGHAGFSINIEDVKSSWESIKIKMTAELT